jgi:uncharacterized protein
MKSFYTTFLLFLLQNYVIAQIKPELPPNFYDTFSYSLPKNFQYTNEEQLSIEIQNIGKELLKLETEAESKYSIMDSTQLYYATLHSSDLDIFSKNYQSAIDKIYLARKLRPTPIYQMPFSLIKVAYCKACLTHTDDGSKEFAQILIEKLISEYRTINSDFRNDIINQAKGSYTLASIDVWWKNVGRTIDQAQNNAGGKLDIDNAISLFNSYQLYLLRKKYQPQIEQSLFAISSSKVQEEVVKIPMKDGVRLNAYLYKDIVNKEKLPAIISLSPYPNGLEATKGNIFATNGYIYVYVDTRGRRESEGDFMPYKDDAKDFYDIIDWVSKQSWCNGKVATTGGSYLGFDQWQAIRTKYKHPALMAINPMVSVGFGVDFPRSGNMFYPYILQWATYVSGKELNQPLFSDWKFWSDKNYLLYKNRLPFYKLDSVVGMPNKIFQKWISHPNFDSYWQNILPNKDDYKSIDIPIFSITGYYDGDQIGAMYYYNKHQKYGTETAKNNHYLLIGPYDHGGAQWQPSNIQAGIVIESEAQIPIYKFVIWWFDWVLKGKQKPDFIKDKITYFETGSHAWKGTSSFEKLTADSLELYLTPSLVPNNKRKDLHSLSLQRSTISSPIIYKHDIAMALDSAYFYSSTKPFDDSIYMTSKHNLVFESMPLQKDITLSNKIISRVYATLNVPDADFEMSLQEIDSEGKDRKIASGKIRVRYRNGGEKPVMAKNGEVVELNFEDILIYIKKIPKGSKLRLIFQSINNPWSEKNFGFGGIVSRESTTAERIIKANILTGGKYASKVVLPISKN